MDFIRIVTRFFFAVDRVLVFFNRTSYEMIPEIIKLLKLGTEANALQQQAKNKRVEEGRLYMYGGQTKFGFKIALISDMSDHAQRSAALRPGRSLTFLVFIIRIRTQM